MMNVNVGEVRSNSGNGLTRKFTPSAQPSSIAACDKPHSSS
jgi:hypothetical protein